MTEQDDGRDDVGGDPACWLSRVCPECGRIADDDPPTRCAGCGAPSARSDAGRSGQAPT